MERTHRTLTIVRSISSTALVFVAALALAAHDAAAQAPGVAAGFQVDGQLYSGPLGDDWAQGASHAGVLTNSGAGDLAHLPAFYGRDAHWAQGAVDPNHFWTRSNKNNDYIDAGTSPWYWGPGNGPQKNDITDVYAHVRKDANGDTWMFVAAATRAVHGDSHLDFEFNVAGVKLVGTTQGQIVGMGPKGGRTVGDILLSTDFVNGGKHPIPSVRVWKKSGAVYQFVKITPPAGTVLSATNLVDVPAGPWGAISPKGPVSTTQIGLQLVEAGVNLTKMGITPAGDCAGVATMMVKTRSSQSFTAELKDFALVPFAVVPAPKCNIWGVEHICAGQSSQFCGPDNLASYSWSGPNGFTASTQCTGPIVDAGVYTLKVGNGRGCESTCSLELHVQKSIDCKITGDAWICNGKSTTLCGLEGLASYAWSGPKGFSSTARCIEARDAGGYTLQVGNGAGCEGTCSVELKATTCLKANNEADLAPATESLELYRAMPNPFRTTMRFAYDVSDAGGVSVDVGVFDVSGRKISVLDRGFRAPGHYQARWNGRDASGQRVGRGVYFLRASIGSRQILTRVLYLQ